MRQILIAVAVALTVSILLTPALIRLFTKQGFGHHTRDDGPPSHHTKRGTPSMGGVAIVAGIWVAISLVVLVARPALGRRIGAELSRVGSALRRNTEGLSGVVRPAS